MTKRIILGVFVTISYIFLSLQSVLAWGPERPTYTMENPADHVTFNSITNNSAIGDEREFVRIVDKAAGGKYVTEMEIEANKDYEVYIYYHNNASRTLNDKAHNYKGVAYNTKLATDFPSKLAAGERGQVYASISSPTATPEKVWDETFITAKEDMTLHYVTGSAKIHNSWDTNGAIVPTYMFSPEGTYLGMNELNGMIFGCGEFSGHIIYTIRNKSANDDVKEKGADNQENTLPDQETTKKTAETDTETDIQTDDSKKSTRPVILVCAALGITVVIVKALSSRRK